MAEDYFYQKAKNQLFSFCPDYKSSEKKTYFFCLDLSNLEVKQFKNCLISSGISSPEFHFGRLKGILEIQPYRISSKNLSLMTLQYKNKKESSSSGGGGSARRQAIGQIRSSLSQNTLEMDGESSDHPLNTFKPILFVNPRPEENKFYEDQRPQEILALRLLMDMRLDIMKGPKIYNFTIMSSQEKDGATKNFSPLLESSETMISS